MPIPREQFEKDLSTEQAQYLQFLEHNPDQAYTVEEIFEGVHIQLPPDRVWRAVYLWSQANELRALARRGLVDTKVINAKTYYAIKQRPP
jgi:hypothetical protein